MDKLDKRPARPAGHVRQRQAIILLDLPKGFLDWDYKNGRTIPVRGSPQATYYPLDGIRDYLAGKPDRLLTIDQTVKALDTTPQRLADHIQNIRAGYGTLLHLPFETFPSGELGFRVSAVLDALDVLCAEAED